MVNELTGYDTGWILDRISQNTEQKYQLGIKYQIK
jgi:hypothetical protein